MCSRQHWKLQMVGANRLLVVNLSKQMGLVKGGGEDSMREWAQLPAGGSVEVDAGGAVVAVLGSTEANARLK
jgi:hypothetical protein